MVRIPNAYTIIENVLWAINVKASIRDNHLIQCSFMYVKLLWRCLLFYPKLKIFNYNIEDVGFIIKQYGRLFCFVLFIWLIVYLYVDGFVATCENWKDWRKFLFNWPIDEINCAFSFHYLISLENNQNKLWSQRSSSFPWIHFIQFKHLLNFQGFYSKYIWSNFCVASLLFLDYRVYRLCNVYIFFFAIFISAYKKKRKIEVRKGEINF